MPRETVVDAGDGACTILRCGCLLDPCSCGLAVLDCGVYRGSPLIVKDRLVAALGADLPRVDKLVVSHFDADHWDGLRLLAADLGDAAPGLSLTLHYPGLPSSLDALPSTVLALVLTAQGTGLRALELIGALEAAGRVVSHLPLFAGDTLTLAGRQFKIYWPPAHLDVDTARLLHRAVTETRELAEALAAAQHPALLDNLNAAYHHSVFNANSSADRADPESGRSAVGDISNRPEDDHPITRPPGAQSANDWEEWRLGPARREVDDVPATRTTPALSAVHHHSPDYPLADVPPHFRARFRAVLELGRRASNDVSLVIGEMNGHFAAFGDARPLVQRHALQTMRDSYGVVLAPHHGTYPVSPQFPTAQLCVSQAGSHHVGQWLMHVTSHRQARSCVNTAHVGTISAW